MLSTSKYVAVHRLCLLPACNNVLLLPQPIKLEQVIPACHPHQPPCHTKGSIQSLPCMAAAGSSTAQQ